jgi:hypothetical protein
LFGPSEPSRWKKAKSKFPVQFEIAASGFWSRELPHFLSP